MSLVSRFTQCGDEASALPRVLPQSRDTLPACCPQTSAGFSYPPPCPVPPWATPGRGYLPAVGSCSPWERFVSAGAAARSGNSFLPSFSFPPPPRFPGLYFSACVYLLMNFALFLSFSGEFFNLGQRAKLLKKVLAAVHGTGQLQVPPSAPTKDVLIATASAACLFSVSHWFLYR